MAIQLSSPVTAFSGCVQVLGAAVTGPAHWGDWGCSSPREAVETGSSQELLFMESAGDLGGRVYVRRVCSWTFSSLLGCLSSVLSESPAHYPLLDCVDQVFRARCSKIR